ncbi:MAG: hypothetical protein ACUVUG_06290 [Candidatus Aminicenantia bacterium]
MEENTKERMPLKFIKKLRDGEELYDAFIITYAATLLSSFRKLYI